MHDSTLADGLNELALAYTYLNSDTAIMYAQKAYDEASKGHYSKGVLQSLNNNARITGYGLRNFPKAETISRQAIDLYKNKNIQNIVAGSYMNLALALFCQAAFDRAAQVCDTIIQTSKVTGNKTRLAEATALQGCISFETAHYEKSFEYFKESLYQFKRNNDSYNIAIVLAKLGDLFRLAGDNTTALNYYFESLKYPKGQAFTWYPLADLGDSYYALEPGDSISSDENKYIESIKLLTIRPNYIALSRIHTAEKFIDSHEYHKALPLLTKELDLSRTRSDENITMRLLLDLAKAFEGKHNYSKAIAYIRELLQAAGSHKANPYIREANRMLFKVYDVLNKTDSSYFYYKQYTAIKETIALNDISKKLSIYKASTETEKKETQIALLTNQQLIDKQKLALNKQQLKSELFLKNVLYGSIVVLLFLGLIVFRTIRLKQKAEERGRQLAEKELYLQKLESEQMKDRLHQQATELEMQALRAQMNPHFIFNSLNSINRFILQNNKAQASEYLAKFSRLVRLILQNSQFDFIPLESEIDALRLYLELESVRFNDHFSFSIQIDKDIDVSGVKVPPLIIQPYAENAIWHGLMQKEEKGHLQIDLFEEGSMQCYRITDDGVGRKKAAALKTKSAATHKSMGMQITANRIAMLLKEAQSATQIIVTDLVLPDGAAGGTEVLIKIPSRD